MPKAGELDWTDLYKGETRLPEDSRSRPLGYTGPTLKKGEIPRKPSNEEIAKAILEGAPKQPTDEQMFGHLVVTEEQAKAAEDAYNNMFTDFFKQVQAPIEKQNLNKSWGSRGPIWEETLSEEEERIRQIPVNPGILESD